MLSKYQLMIFDFNNISIGNVKKLVPTISDREKYVLHSENLQLYLRLGLKLKEYIAYQNSIYHNSENHMWNFTRKEKSRNTGKDGKALYKLMNNAVYGKARANLRGKIDVKLVSNKKDYLEQAPKPTYISKQVFDNDLVVIRKSKVTLTLTKSACEHMFTCAYQI